MYNGLKFKSKSKKTQSVKQVVPTQVKPQAKQQKIETLLTESGSINWLKTRCQTTAQPQYLKTRDELDQEQEVKDVFMRIDYDCSGKIDMTEMGKVFKNNGINMSRDEIEEFFSLCQTQSHGKMNFNEFKSLYQNPNTEQLFRKYVKRSRLENTKCKQQVYVPFNMSKFLEHMSLKQRRETLVGRLEK